MPDQVDHSLPKGQLAEGRPSSPAETSDNGHDDPELTASEASDSTDSTKSADSWPRAYRDWKKNGGEFPEKLRGTVWDDTAPYQPTGEQEPKYSSWYPNQWPFGLQFEPDPAWEWVCFPAECVAATTALPSYLDSEIFTGRFKNSLLGCLPPGIAPGEKYSWTHRYRAYNSQEPPAYSASVDLEHVHSGLVWIRLPQECIPALKRYPIETKDSDDVKARKAAWNQARDRDDSTKSAPATPCARVLAQEATPPESRAVSRRSRQAAPTHRAAILGKRRRTDSSGDESDE